MKKISVIIIGGGGRGTIYSQHLQKIMEKAEVAAIAEPREYFRNRIADMHNIPQENTPQEEIIEYTTPTVVYMSSILSNKGSDGCVYTEMHPYPGLENVLEDRLPGENFVYLIKIDPSAKSMKVDCDVPGCKHNDASCPGIIRYANSSMMFTAPAMLLCLPG